MQPVPLMPMPKLYSCSWLTDCHGLLLQYIINYVQQLYSSSDSPPNVSHSLVSSHLYTAHRKCYLPFLPLLLSTNAHTCIHIHTHMHTTTCIPSNNSHTHFYQCGFQKSCIYSCEKESAIKMLQATNYTKQDCV